VRSLLGLLSLLQSHKGLFIAYPFVIYMDAQYWLTELAYLV